MLEIGSYVDGKYKILNKIGEGGSGNVYLAMNESANKTWAVKEVKKEDKDPDTQTIFKNSLMVEIDLMKKLRHKYLPSIVDVINQEDSFLIVMDFVDGKSLDNYLENGPCPEKAVIEWAKQLCDVLSYLHKCDPPIIYRDLKPGNIMLKTNGEITLIDFGAAREFKQSAKSSDTVCLGTPGYAAPEQWGGNGQTDARTDIYCLGTTLYHLVTGIEPRPSEMRPIRQINPNLSSGLEDIILRCTMLNPQDRYQSCEEVYYALEHYEELEHSYRRMLKNRVRLLGVMSGLCVLMASGAVYGFVMESKTRNSSYDVYLAQAEEYSSADQEKKLEGYRNAVNLNPSDERAYLSLISYLTSDGVYSTEDDIAMSSILYGTTSENTTNESVFKTNPKGYSEFSFEMGNAYFFYYDGSIKTAKTEAKKWFDHVLELGQEEERKTKRAEIYSRIGGYYETLGTVDITGEKDASTYAELWEDLTLLGDNQGSDLGNDVTLLTLYSEILYQIDSNAVGLLKNGISAEVLEEEIDSLLSKAALVESRENTEALLAKVEERGAIAKRTIDTASAYQNAGGISEADTVKSEE